MAIIAPIFTAIFGALIGIYINNIYTWKIKNKIETLDKLYLHFSEYIQWRSTFIKLHGENCAVSKTTDMNFLSDDKANDFYAIANKCQLDCKIIDINSIHEKFRDLHINHIMKYAKDILEHKTISNVEAILAEPFNTLISEITKDIFDSRDVITSFPYIFKELTCNKIGIFFCVILLIIISCRLFYSFNYAKQINNPVYLLQILTN